MHRWWQTGIVYQIYTRSFQDSDGDGVGDLQGIIGRLDYVCSLGVDAIWLTPFYPSPMHDFGYDVADYQGVDALFGSLDDFDELVRQTHHRGLKLLVDFVPNHTSDEHPWFVQGRRARDDPRRDWYIWCDPAADGGPPNNWLSIFGGPAWTLDTTTGQYYLHQYLPQQPELNCRNPEVVAAMCEVLRFWLDRGVDGFRVDVIGRMIKDSLLRDEPQNELWDGRWDYQRLSHIHTYNLPEVHEVIRTFRRVLDQYPDRVMVGELNFLDLADIVDYYGADLDECHLPFNFKLIHHPWDAVAVRKTIDRYEALLPAGAWPNWVLGNHDWHRLVTRVGREQGRVATMLLLTLRGTPTWYCGDELGMANTPIAADQVKDPWALRNPSIAQRIGRDPVRTPMLWDSSTHAGFCAPAATPWLPLSPDWQQINVQAQSNTPGSTLELFRCLTRLRRSEPSLSLGDYRSLDSAHADVLAYCRWSSGHDAFVVLLNFADATRLVDLSAAGTSAELAVSTHPRPDQQPFDLSAVELTPNEGVVLRLPNGAN